MLSIVFGGASLFVLSQILHDKGRTQLSKAVLPVGFGLKRQRQEAILLSLDKLGFASRSQLQKIHRLGGDRNACRVLADLAEYVNWFRDIENVYYLNKKGAERIGSGKVLSKNQNYRHVLMRNDLYIYLGQPVQWKNEQIVEVPGKLKIVSDAFFQDKSKKLYFVEIDNLQKMAENRKKIDAYKRLKDMGVVQKQYGQFPRLIWVTISEVRRQRLMMMCKKAGLDADIYLEMELK